MYRHGIIATKVATAPDQQICRRVNSAVYVTSAWAALTGAGAAAAPLPQGQLPYLPSALPQIPTSPQVPKTCPVVPSAPCPWLCPHAATHCKILASPMHTRLPVQQWLYTWNHDKRRPAVADGSRVLGWSRFRAQLFIGW